MAYNSPLWNEETGWAALDQLPQQQFQSNPGYISGGMPGGIFNENSGGAGSSPFMTTYQDPSVTQGGSRGRSGGGYSAPAGDSSMAYMQPAQPTAQPQPTQQYVPSVGTGLYPGMPQSPGYTAPGGGTNTPPPATIASPALMANSMGMQGAQNVGGTGMYTGANAPLDLNRFTPAQGPSTITNISTEQRIQELTRKLREQYPELGFMNYLSGNPNRGGYSITDPSVQAHYASAWGRALNTNLLGERSLQQAAGIYNPQEVLATLERYAASPSGQQIQQTGPPTQPSAPRPPYGQPPQNTQPTQQGNPYQQVAQPGAGSPYWSNIGIQAPGGNSYNPNYSQQGGYPTGDLDGNTYDVYGNRLPPNPNGRAAQRRNGTPVIGSPGMMGRPGQMQVDPAYNQVNPFSPGARDPRQYQAEQQSFEAFRSDPRTQQYQQAYTDVLNSLGLNRPKTSNDLFGVHTEQETQLINSTMQQRYPQLANYMNNMNQQLQQYHVPLEQQLSQAGYNMPSGGQNEYNYSRGGQQQPNYQQQAAQFSSDPATQQAYIQSMYGGGQQQQAYSNFGNDPQTLARINAERNMPTGGYGDVDFRAATFGGGSLFPDTAKTPGAATTGSGGTNTPANYNPMQGGQLLGGGNNSWGGASNRRSGFGGMSLFGNGMGGGNTGGGQTYGQPASQYRGAGSYGRPASYGQSQRPSGY